MLAEVSRPPKLPPPVKQPLLVFYLALGRLRKAADPPRGHISLSVQGIRS